MQLHSHLTFPTFLQIEFLTSKAAAGILITENEIRCNCNADASMPERLNLYYMNVAHVYKNMYRQVRKAFELAGLSGHISVHIDYSHYLKTRQPTLKLHFIFFHIQFPGYIQI